jgi:hypothetical protein
MKNLISLNTRNLKINKTCQLGFNEGHLELYKASEEPENTCRLRIKFGEMEAEWQPTKGLSLGQIWWKGEPVFWEAPFLLPDPVQLDLQSNEICINGKQAPGFTFLKTFCGGIELYGLRNWGMLRHDSETGKLYPLHGETSNIPLEEVQVEINDDGFSVKGIFYYRDFLQPDDLPWYERGEPVFEVQREYKIISGPFPEISLKDAIVNLDEKPQKPDWGYHFTLHPEPGAKMQVNSARSMNRDDGKLPENAETWFEATRANQRQETGIIHQGIALEAFGGKPMQKVLFVYPSGKKTEVFFTPVPYFQSWFCCGGFGSKEFTDAEGNSILAKNWDGMGFEIGSSALDHDGNTDPAVPEPGFLQQNEKQEMEIIVRLS